MHTSPARYRAILLPAVLIAGLFGATTVSAADGPTTSPASPTVAGSGVLAAEGDGHVRLAGSYILADGTVVYRFADATGHFWIAGRTIATTIESHAMRFSAAGHGRAWLVGTGSYWVNGRGANPWTEPGVAATF